MAKKSRRQTEDLEWRLNSIFKNKRKKAMEVVLAKLIKCKLKCEEAGKGINIVIITTLLKFSFFFFFFNYKVEI